jgi:alkanesulfonate monooxygenase SsuD/methylene tetrahydromethanopterin reductase-like flavin-dependent oxidoreductase (luciferase family)
MQVGYGAILQNASKVTSDHAMYRNELRLARSAEGRGFGSVWTTEHHFTGYMNCPNALQFLSYMAGTSETLELGTMCVVLPWHNPLRVAEEVLALDHQCDGRLTLGIARGAGAAEFDGYKVDMNVTRPIFIEYSEMLLEALESGYAEYDGAYLKQPRVELRPAPFKSFKGRRYCGAVSPESMEIMAKLGVGMLITPSKPWEQVAKEMAEYHQCYRKYHGDDPVPTIATGWVFCDESADRAREIGGKFIKDYWQTTLNHYGFNKPETFKGKKGYENYAAGAEVQAKMKADEIAEAFLDFHVYGTPEQCYEKIMKIRGHIGCKAFTGIFSYADMPVAEVERSLGLFAKKVLPELKKVPDPKTFGSVAP